MGHDFSEAIGHGKIGSSSKNTLMLVEIRLFFGKTQVYNP